MPDITMCSSQVCVLRKDCYRNGASGTVPSERQSMFAGLTKHGADCDYYWPLPSRMNDFQWEKLEEM